MRRQTDRGSSCRKKEYRRENIETREKEKFKERKMRGGGRKEERKKRKQKRREMKIEIMLTGEENQ